MNDAIEKVISDFIDKKRLINNCYFSNGEINPPQLAYQVNFPRLEIIIEGQQEIIWHNGNQSEKKCLQCNDALFICAKSWNKPIWSKPVTTLSILFGKQQLGFSLLRWDGSAFSPLEQLNTERRGPRVGTFILQTLTELSINYDHHRSANTASLLILSLLSHSWELLTSQFETISKATALFESIRHYIDNNFQQNMSRELLAQLFHISPNYLSLLFQKEGNIGLNEYITQTRLEHAKTLLKRYELNVKEIAMTAGFQDSNYFCRIFKRKTARSPSEYRKQYHSKISNKLAP